MFGASDALVMSIVTAILTLAGTIFSGVMAYLMAKLNKKQDAAAVKVEEVAVKQEETLTKQDKVLEVIVTKVEEVHKATNGMVAKLEKASFAAGVKSEKEKNEDS